MKTNIILSGLFILLHPRICHATEAFQAIEGLPGAFEPLATDPRNESVAIDQQLGGGLNLFKRQTCAAGYAYCPKYAKCCYPGEGCCPDGCVSSDADMCCTNGGYCTTGKKCCGNGCIPTTGDCCSDGGYCPSPFICIKLLSTGRIVCCTDTTCDVYLGSNGQTMTGSTEYITSSYTDYTTATRTVSYTNYEYYTYSTTIYWYYWYYFYTIYYSPSTYTTRTKTTVTRTTTLTISATDTYDAYVYFSSASSNLPTPGSAEVSIPPTPPAGALVLGSCSETSTLDDGDVTSYCDTVTASPSNTRTTRASSSASSGTSAAFGTSATSTLFGSSNGGGASDAVSGVQWVPMGFVFCGALFGLLMVVL